MSRPEVRCAGCGLIYSGAFIRCGKCHTPTRVSRGFWAKQAERRTARRRGCIVIPLAALGGWAVLVAVIYAVAG